MGQGAGREGEDLLGVFSIRSSSTNNNPLDASALCVYPLDELDRHIDSTRDLCYTQDGRVEGIGEVAYIEYEVKSSCANLPLVRTQQKKEALFLCVSININLMLILIFSLMEEKQII